MTGDKVYGPDYPSGLDRDEVRDLLDELQETIDKAAEIAQMIPGAINPYEHSRLVSELTGSEGPYVGSGIPDYIKGIRQTLNEEEVEEENAEVPA